MRIVVTGGAGALGSLVVDRARSRGHDVVPASRRTGVDLATGDGLVAVLESADAVIHCASNPRRPKLVDVEGTRRLAAAIPDSVHLVHVSIVGCEANPFPYYRAKAEAENLLARAERRVTVVRATQFHPFAATIARALTKGPFVATVGDLAFQTVDTGWVAEKLVEHAVGVAPDGFARATDLAGPEVITLGEMAGRIRAHDGRRAPRVIRLPVVGRTLGAFNQGTHLPGPEAEIGGPAFDEWLAGQ